MSFDVQWDNDEKTVLRFAAGERWDWNEFHKRMRLSQFMLDRVDHPVEAIIDLSQSVKMPAGAVGHLRSLGKQDHPNRTPRIVIIGVDPTLRQQLGSADGVYRTPTQLIRFVSSDTDARRIIAEWQRDHDS